MLIKGFVTYLLLFLLLSLVVTGGLMLYLKRNSPNTLNTQQVSSFLNNGLDTKTYTNAEHRFSFRYPSNWTLFDDSKDSDSKTALKLILVPVPEGEPWGDAFISQVYVHNGIGDMEKWFKEQREFNEEKIENYIQLVNETFEQDYLTSGDVKVQVTRGNLLGRPTIIQIETVRCPESPTCHILGWPTGYEKWVFIANKNEVIEFYVTTYAQYENTKTFDAIIDSLEIF